MAFGLVGFVLSSTVLAVGIPLLAVYFLYHYSRSKLHNARYGRHEQQTVSGPSLFSTLRNEWQVFSALSEAAEGLEIMHQQLTIVQQDLVAKASRHPKLSHALGPGIVTEPWQSVSGQTHTYLDEPCLAASKD